MTNGEDAESGSTEIGADCKVLAFTNDNVSTLAAVISRCFQSAGCKKHWIDNRDRTYLTRGTRIGEFIDVFNETEVINLREDDGSDFASVGGDEGLDGLAAESTRFFIGCDEHEFDGRVFAVRLEYFDVTREKISGDEDGVGVDLGHAHGADGGFEEGAGAIVQRGVDCFETG